MISNLLLFPLEIYVDRLGITCLHSIINSGLISLDNGLFTQASQAYGAKRFEQVGILLQKAIYVNFCLLILISPVIFYSEEILIGVGIERAIAKYASQFLKYCIPSNISLAIWDAFKVAE